MTGNSPANDHKYRNTICFREQISRFGVQQITSGINGRVRLIRTGSPPLHDDGVSDRPFTLLIGLVRHVPWALA